MSTKIEAKTPLFTDKAVSIDTFGKAVAFKLNIKNNPNHYDSLVELYWYSDVSLPEKLPSKLKVLSANFVKEIPVLPKSVIDLECFSAKSIKAKITKKFRRLYYNKNLVEDLISTNGIEVVRSDL